MTGVQTCALPIYRVGNGHERMIFHRFSGSGSEAKQHTGYKTYISHMGIRLFNEVFGVIFADVGQTPVPLLQGNGRMVYVLHKP